MIRFIDLFAGVGGFHYGLDYVNQQQETGESGLFSSRNQSNITNLNGNIGNKQYQCVYSNEYDKYANSVYKYHFGECDIRDIRDVAAEELPDFDLLCGGFPCQSFSIAGKRRGFEDTRGTMFFEIARLLRAKQPRLCLLENVKGLLSHDNGNTFKTIIATLTELGYDCQWQVLNSKNFGVPQNRERIFIVGHLRGTPRPEVFPLIRTNEVYSQSNKAQEKICAGTLTARQFASWNGNYVREPELKFIGGVVGKRDLWLKDGKQNSRNFSQGQRVYGSDRIASTLAGNAGGLGGKTGLYRVEGTKIRRLTPIECERLQGFPDDWTKIGVNGEISDTQRYKMMGNAVTTNVVTEIGKRLYV